MLGIQDRGLLMTISQIKNDLKYHIGDKAIIKCNLGRNKYEKYNYRT